MTIVPVRMDGKAGYALVRDDKLAGCRKERRELGI
jgi:hypothetical protein